MSRIKRLVGKAAEEESKNTLIRNFIFITMDLLFGKKEKDKDLLLDKKRKNLSLMH